MHSACPIFYIFCRLPKPAKVAQLLRVTFATLASARSAIGDDDDFVGPRCYFAWMEGCGNEIGSEDDKKK